MSGEDYAEYAANLRNTANEERAKFYSLVKDCGCSAPLGEGWTNAVHEASAEIRRKWETSGPEAFAAALAPSNEPPRRRVVPSDYIPVKAEDIVGMAAALAYERARRYESEATLAEFRAAHLVK